jgi:hypothetical protein
MLRKASVAVAIVCILAGALWADVPQLVNYQGKLTSAAGAPIEGTVSVGFGFYDAQTVGNLLYSEEQTVTAAKGIFHVLIGNGTNPQGDFASICAGDSVWLELTVAGQAMAPRHRIGSVVFSLRAGAVDGQADILARLAALEQKLQAVSYDGTTLWVSAANLQVVNGTGSTGTKNAVGNLIVGYNELRGDGTDLRTGSHNLVVGAAHSYSSFAGLVAGYRNTLSNGYCSVSGGFDNTASDECASVSGGWGNTASRVCASVSGGWGNTASRECASVSGGYENTASGMYSSVSGGYENKASGWYSTVSGGYGNTASGDETSVSGGYGNTASGYGASVSGGYQRSATGMYDWRAGGLFQDQ